MSRRNAFIGTLSDEEKDVIVEELLDEQSLAAGFGLWTTPGLNDPESAWLQIIGPTPSTTTGPDGGANPITRAVEPANGYGYNESTTVADGPWSLESPSFDASLGTISLTFDYFMKFGSLGLIADGTLRVQGWNGLAWSNLGAAIVGSQQQTSSELWLQSDVYTSDGFDNDDFQFRILVFRGANEFPGNYDFCVDNLRLFGPEGALNPPPDGGGGTPPDPPPANDARTPGFNTGLRRLHVAKDGSQPLDGTILPANRIFTSIQAGVNAVIAGDVLTIKTDRYQETPNISNRNGTVANPIWICAEEPGGVVIDNYIQGAFNGTVTWRNDGGGVFSIPGSRPYIGYDNVSKEFLPGFRSVSDITAATIPTVLGPNSPSGSISKPSRGFGFSGGRISVRLNGGINPNGRSIALTDGFTETLWNLSNADNIIIDGIKFDGAGDGASLSIGSGCSNCTVQNCVFESCQFGIRLGSGGVIIKRCEFTMVGIGEWQQALAVTNGATVNALFKYAKNYYTASLVGGTDSDALLEGGLDVSVFGSTVSTVRITECLMQECFEGSKAGRHRNVEVDLCVFDRCFDDAVELETASSGQSISGDFELHDCRIRNCFVGASHQGSVVHLDHYVYRNIFEITDQNIIHPPYHLKMINCPSTVDIFYYHNLMVNPSTIGNDGFGNSHTVWFPFGPPSGDADKIDRWFNNIVFQADLDTAQTNPITRENNVVASPANNSQSQTVQGSGGTFAGTTLASLGLGPNQELLASSPAVNAGRSLPGGLPDSRGGAGVNDDCGPFPFGEDPGPDWPRAATREFTLTLPVRWTSPGA